MQKEKPRVGIGVVVVKDNKVLMGRRRGSHGSGDWAFPGGHLEFGETPEACASRELFEETGLKAYRVSSGPWTNNIFHGNKHYITIFMIVTEFSGVVQLLEPEKCENWDWFEWDHLPQPLFASVQSFVDDVGIDNLKMLDVTKAFSLK